MKEMLEIIRLVFKRIEYWIEKWVPRISDFLLVLMLTILMFMTIAVLILFFRFLRICYLSM